MVINFKVLLKLSFCTGAIIHYVLLLPDKQIREAT